MTDLYGVLFQKLLYPAWESGLRRRPTLAHLERLERTQWCSADELRTLQDEELKKLLNHAWNNVANCRRRFEEAGLSPNDITGVSDLAKLPLLTREAASSAFEERDPTVDPLPRIFANNHDPARRMREVFLPGAR